MAKTIVSADRTKIKFDPNDVAHVRQLIQWLWDEEQIIFVEDVLDAIDNRHHPMYAAEFAASLEAKSC